MVQLRWFPKEPNDAATWQRVIDDAYGPPAVGTVELLLEAGNWCVQLADMPAGGAYKKGVRLRRPRRHDMRDIVIGALLEAGLPVTKRA